MPAGLYDPARQLHEEIRPAAVGVRDREVRVGPVVINHCEGGLCPVIAFEI